MLHAGPVVKDRGEAIGIKEPLKSDITREKGISPLRWLEGSWDLFSLQPPKVKAIFTVVSG